MSKSALSAALQSKDGSSAAKVKPTVPLGASSSSNLSRSAFSCLYQDEKSVEDTFEVDLNLNKLSLGTSPGPSSFRRRSLDDPDDNQRWEKLGSLQMVSKFMSPGSLGSSLSKSLPRPMAPSARRASGLDTPSPSPHILSHKEILPEQLSARSAEGRRLRRKVLRGTVLVCVVAGYSGKRFIYERAQELGVRMVILDAADCWAAGLEKEGIISKFIPIDFHDESTVFDTCVQHIKAVEKEYGQLDGVISFWELSQPLVARLAEHLGLPGNPPDAVDAARDKYRTREMMKQAGLPTPRNMAVTSPSQLQKAAETVGFPAVLKPTSGAASVGVIKVESLEDLDRVYKRVCREVASVTQTADGTWKVDGAEDADADGAEVVQDKSGAKYVAQTFIMEQYLDGPEVDVDLLFSGGEAVYGAISDNWPTVEPYFNETGSNCPSELPHDQQKALCDLSVAAAKCLGFQMGALHVECKFTSTGPQLIEVNARLGGGPVALMNQLVWGVDLVEEQFLASAGIPSRPYLAKRPDKFVAENSVNAKKTGILKDVDFIEKFEKEDDVIYLRPLVHPGDEVTAIQDGMPTWVYEVLVTKSDLHTAIEYVKRVERELDLLTPIEPKPTKKTGKQ